MKRFDTREAARIVALPERSIRACVRAGCLTPERDADGRYSFGFRDLSVLRTARRLFDSGLPASRVAKALGTLRRQLPDEAHLSSVTIRADGRRLVASDGASQWEPDSGQLVLDFAEPREETLAVADLAVANDRAPAAPAGREVTATGPVTLRVIRSGGAPGLERPSGGAPPRTRRPQPGDDSDAEDWFEAACELEAHSPLEAHAAYARAIELDASHDEAHLNLGRLHHQAGDLGKAEALYRAAVGLAPDDAVPHFNLGVLLEERRRRDEAVYAYRQAIARAPDFADAHYNLGLLCESLGRRAEALKHMSEAKRLYEEGGE